MYKKFSCGFIVAIIFSSCHMAYCATAQSTSFVQFDAHYASKMLSHTTAINRKPLLLLNHKKYTLDDHALYLSTRIITLADYQHSNRRSKFAYLMRHPTSANQIGSTVSEAVIHSMQFAATGNFSPWFSTYAELLYDPQQSFGTGTITTLTRNQIQLRKGYVLAGDLNRSPLYFAIGKLPTPFGLTDTVAPFTSSSVWHAFGGLAYGALIAADTSHLTARAMLVQGGAQFRSHNVHVHDTNVPSKLNNYVLDVYTTQHFGQDVNINFGGSYQRGSAYCQNFPITHFAGCNMINPAWAVYLKVDSPQFEAIGEFTRTTRNWPGTRNPSPPLNIYGSSKVTAFDIGGKYYLTTKLLPKPLAIAIDFSEFRAGAKHSPWDRQAQFILAASTWFSDSIKLFASYVRTLGFSPLNFISGDNPLEGSAAGTTWSDSDARSNVFLLGIEAAI